MSSKKVIFFFCYRFFELRLLITSSLLKELKKKFRVIIFVPYQIKSIAKSNLPKDSEIFNLKFQSDKILKKERNLRGKIENFLRMILSLTYSNESRICSSYSTQIKSFLNSRKKGTYSFVKMNLVVVLAKLSSNFRIIRKIIQKIIFYLLKSDHHHSEYVKYKPTFVLVGSLGLDVDANVIKESKKMKTKSIVLTQSWDRTVCKGFPIIESDYIFVWNEHMKQECVDFLDIKKNKIFVVGAPVWDNFFKKKGLVSRNNFLSSLKLNPKKKTIYYPLSAALWHDELIVNLNTFIENLKKKNISDNIQIIFRVHPFYHAEKAEKRRQLFNLLKKLSTFKNVFVNFNDVEKKKNIYVLKRKDIYFTLNAYQHSEMTLSAVSSAMVEALFFNNYVINIICGKGNIRGAFWDLKNQKLHHLEHLYSYKLINNVYSHNDLIKKIKEGIGNKNNKAKLKDFVDKEASRFKGKSAEAYLNQLLKLSKDEDI